MYILCNNSTCASYYNIRSHIAIWMLLFKTLTTSKEPIFALYSPRKALVQFCSPSRSISTAFYRCLGFIGSFSVIRTWRSNFSVCNWKLFFCESSHGWVFACSGRPVMISVLLYLLKYLWILYLWKSTADIQAAHLLIWKMCFLF